MGSRLFYRVIKLRERLWFKPLLFCAGAIIAIQVARAGNFYPRPDVLSLVTADTIEMLLKIISSSMLAVATFAVGSLVTAYGTASTAGTPRAFQLLVSDDTSQNALSSYIGAFIFSIVALVALRLDFYREGGLVALFALTLAIFTWVVLTFVAWTDNIARLGRLTTIVAKTEDATTSVLQIQRKTPFLGGIKATTENALDGMKITTQDIGHLQHINAGALQAIAEDHDMKIMLNALPGSFASPERPLAILSKSHVSDDTRDRILTHFVIGEGRSMTEDPRFGLVILSETALRALSPAVNDPGTAIMIIGRMVRLFSLWAEDKEPDPKATPDFDRLLVPPLNVEALFDDAFRGISRDGAAMVEVAACLQKAMVSLSHVQNGAYRTHAKRIAEQALMRAEVAMTHDFDVEAVREAGRPLLA